MATKINEIVELRIEKLIFSVRGEQVMLDRDLARLYGVETKVLNQAVKRNMERFPDGFMFQLSKEEVEGLTYLTNSADTNLICQNVISRFSSESEDYDEDVILRSQNATSSWGGLRYQPYVFTEQGVAMLSAVLKSPVAVAMSQLCQCF